MLSMTHSLVIWSLVICICHSYPSTLNRMDHESINALVKPQNSLPVGIIGGKETKIEKHPHQVAILVNKKLEGAGIILDDKHIATLASVVYTKLGHKSGVEVSAGNSDYKKGNFFKVKSISVHPKFDIFSLSYDIAVLQLEKPLKFSHNVRKISVGPKVLRDESIVVLSGWGSKSKDYLDKHELTEFKEATLKIKNPHDCKLVYKNYNVTDTMICAYQKNAGPCWEDFGDVLVSHGKAYGLFSWAKGCDVGSYPSIYTNLVKVNPWMKSIIKKHEDNTEQIINHREKKETSSKVSSNQFFNMFNHKNVNKHDISKRSPIEDDDSDNDIELQLAIEAEEEEEENADEEEEKQEAEEEKQEAEEDEDENEALIENEISDENENDELLVKAIEDEESEEAMADEEEEEQEAEEDKIEQEAVKMANEVENNANSNFINNELDAASDDQITGNHVLFKRETGINGNPLFLVSLSENVKKRNPRSLFGLFLNSDENNLSELAITEQEIEEANADEEEKEQEADEDKKEEAAIEIVNEIAKSNNPDHLKYQLDMEDSQDIQSKPNSVFRRSISSADEYDENTFENEGTFQEEESEDEKYDDTDNDVEGVNKDAEEEKEREEGEEYGEEPEKYDDEEKAIKNKPINRHEEFEEDEDDAVPVMKISDNVLTDEIRENVNW